MTDRPILFSGPMARALLAGTKTQTRRLMALVPPFAERIVRPPGYPTLSWIAVGDGMSGGTKGVRYEIGDRLYVREHWRVDSMWNTTAPRDMPSGRNDRPSVQYEAEGPNSGRGVLEPGRFRQGMHMPRWASRITLTVTDVRVERLQDISPEDARDEGVDRRSWKVRQMWLFGANAEERAAIYLRACLWEYEDLWNQINGAGSWDANPWVAAYTFTVARGNIDAVECGS